MTVQYRVFGRLLPDTEHAVYQVDTIKKITSTSTLENTAARVRFGSNFMLMAPNAIGPIRPIGRSTALR